MELLRASGAVSEYVETLYKSLEWLYFLREPNSRDINEDGVVQSHHYHSTTFVPQELLKMSAP